jgi:hypothetical protein
VTAFAVYAAVRERAQRDAALDELAQIEYSRGQPKHARELLERAKAFWSTQPARFRMILNESQAIVARVNLVEAYSMVGRAKDALPLAQAAVTIVEKQYGLQSPFTIVVHRARGYARLGTKDISGTRADLGTATEIATALGSAAKFI